MDSRSMECDEQPCPSPLPSLHLRPPSSTLLKDVSNFKTPKRTSHLSNFQSPCTKQQFFTASKHTPKSMHSRGPSSALSKSKSKTAAARRLKSLQLDQSKSAYKSQRKKEQAIRSLSKSLTVWLNFLLQNPKSCGCDKIDFSNDQEPTVVTKGKREGGKVMMWRDPKRQRDICWRGGDDEVEGEVGFFETKYIMLSNSLKDVCSLDDLRQRMRGYLSLSCCKEVLDVMRLVCKNIDDGRLKMKAHCPLVTDLGMKKNAISVLMCYNPTWLRIGLYIIFGGDSLFANDDVNPDEEMAFLKLIIEKQFFTHAGLAKAYAYNKKVEGLYRPGYYETLGNVILKRFLLLVLILDRAKSQSILPLKYGIDGVDGGSPLLFTVQSSIKSSRQVIADFLSSDIMHGEGNLLAHLVIVGYKVFHQQCPLVEYDFKVANLFVDLQDGVRLCRAVQLLLQDSSILAKVIVPSDTHKKNVMNCAIALQYLRQAGLMLYDDGTEIMEDDVADGDKELTTSLLWNIFVHLQVPLLINKTIFVEEICKILGTSVDYLNIVNSTHLDLLLNWIQAICGKYNFGVNNFSSLIDGKALWCLLDFYFRKELCCSCSSKEPRETRGEESIMSSSDYTDAFHNFILSQKLTTLLGNIPEVLEMSDILEHNGACSDQSVVILLVFLSSQLVVKKNMGQLNFHKLLGCNCQSPERRRSNINCCFVNSEPLSGEDEKDGHNNEDTVRKFKDLRAWWQEMTAHKYRSPLKKPPTSTLQSFSTSKNCINIERGNAAKVIQFHFRRWIKHRDFLKRRDAVLLLQIVVRAWLAVKHNSGISNSNTNKEKWEQSEKSGRYVKFIAERHGFVKLKRSVLVIQRVARIWIAHRHQAGSKSPDLSNGAIGKASLICQDKVETDLEIEAAVRIQFAWRNFISSKSVLKKCFAATKIQSCFRGWLLRRRFLNQKQATIKIQSHFRCQRCWRAFQQWKVASRSAIVIQSYVRGWIARRGAWRLGYLIVVIQRHFRGWLIRRDFLLQKVAVIKIQSAIRCLNCRTAFQIHRHAATEVQRFVRGQITRGRLLGVSRYRATTPSGSNVDTSRGCFQSFELKILISSALKLQRWWKHVLLLNLKTESAITIQSHVRGWIARQKAFREKHRIFVIQTRMMSAIVIQSHVRGWIARKKASREKHHILVMQVRTKSATIIESHVRGWIARKRASREKQHILVSAIVIQSHVRGWIARKRASREKQHILVSAIVIQSHFRGWIARKGASREKQCILVIQVRMKSAIVIQSHVRGWIARKRASSEKHHILVFQVRTKSAIVIQSHVRGWIARKRASREKHRILVIQAYWKGYLARKESTRQLLDLRMRVQKSAMNVDDGMRIINRLLSALSELLRMKSVSGVLHICATLDMATEHSQKCCEQLVAAGAIKILLKLISSVSRSIPDQEVLKHALSTLRNLARYPDLVDVLIDSHECIETVLWVLLRNKEEGYFIASEILKKICSIPKGVEALWKLTSHLKRLKSLVDDLTRKANMEKRNARSLPAVRENTERRLRVAVELLKLITHG